MRCWPWSLHLYLSLHGELDVGRNYGLFIIMKGIGVFPLVSTSNRHAPVVLSL